MTTISIFKLRSIFVRTTLHYLKVSQLSKRKKQTSPLGDMHINAEVRCLQALLRSSRHACSYVAKHSTDEGLRSEAHRAAARNKAEHEVSNVMRGIVFSINYFLRKHIVHARASSNERTSMVVEILYIVENDPCDVLVAQSVLDDSPLDFNRVSRLMTCYCSVRLMLRPMPIRSLCRRLMSFYPRSPVSKKNSKTPLEHSTMRHQTSTMPSLLNDA